MSQLHAVLPTFLKELRTTYSGSSYYFKLFGDVSRSVVIAWIVYLTADRQLLAYSCLGVPLLAMWSGMIAMSGWSLANELSGKTLDFILASHTRMPVVLFSKTLGQIAYEAISGLVALASVLLVAREVPQVAHVGLLALSLVCVITSLAVTSFFFTPLVVLAGGRPGFFMGIVPFGAVLGGFVMPVDQLPPWLAGLARLLPTSWAMDSAWQSIRGIGSWPSLLTNWGSSLFLSAVWFVFTCVLCQVVEKKVRVKGTLGVS